MEDDYNLEDLIKYSTLENLILSGYNYRKYQTRS